VDPRSDLYAMGVILYEMLTDRLPFDADTAIAIGLKHVSEPPVPPSAHRPTVDRALEAVCLKALAKNPADRHASARDMRAALRAAVGADGGDRSDASLADTQPPPPPRDPVTAMLAGAPSASSRSPSLPKRTPNATTLVAEGPRPKGSGFVLAVLAMVVTAAGVLSWRARANRPHTPSTTLTSAPEAALELASSPPSPSPPQAPDTAETRILPTADPPPAPAPVRQARTPRAVSRHAEAPPAMAPAAPPPDPVSAPQPPPAIAPPPPPSAASTPTAAPIAAATPPPAFDLATARVDLGAAVNVDGASAASVNKAIAGAARGLTRCYADALPRMKHPASDTLTLHVETDEDGVITEARLAGDTAGLPGPCFKAAVLGRRIANVDTGNAGADIPLLLRPR
jgi:serine/threonine-protein kinase